MLSLKRALLLLLVALLPLHGFAAAQMGIAMAQGAAVELVATAAASQDHAECHKTVGHGATTEATPHDCPDCVACAVCHTGALAPTALSNNLPSAPHSHAPFWPWAAAQHSVAPPIKPPKT